MRGLMWRSLLAEQRRVRCALGAALLAAAPLGTAVACGESSSPGHTTSRDAAPGDAPADAGTAPDADAAVTDASTGDAAVEGACIVSAGPRDAAADAGPDADPGCWYDLPCGLVDSGLTVIGCDLYTVDPAEASLDARAFGCWVAQGKGCEGDAYAPGPNGAVTIECTDCLGGGGRRPAGLEEPPPAVGADALGAYFSSMAHEEAASVMAFERLQRELEQWGAPAALVRGAARARCDEIRHARCMARLAAQHGARAARPRVGGQSARSLESMARENAVEGCVHETYGAALLAWQARSAPDSSLRDAFASIAADEARHAALSWAVARWLEQRLDPRSCRRVLRARHRAFRALRRRVLATSSRPFDGPAGRPERAQALRLLDALVAHLA